MDYLETRATFSDDRIFRYELTRIWEYYKPRIAWIMLNPSTADETRDDPTIRRCVGFSKLWNYGGLTIYNLFAYRSTIPAKLYSVVDPVGPCNNAILEAIPNDVPIVCAWGNHGAFKNRSRTVLQYIVHENRFYLRKSKTEEPCHPLYLPYSLPLIRF